MKKLKQSLIITISVVVFVLGIQFLVSFFFNENSYADIATSSVATLSNPWSNTNSLVEYYGNGGRWEKDGISQGEYDTYPYQVKYAGNETYHYEINYFKRYGYIFKGWNTEKDGSGVYVMPGEEDINFKKLGVVAPRYKGYDFFSLYAQWEYKEWIVEFKDYAGNIISKQSIPNGGSATLPASPLNAVTDKGEYRFLNWDRSFTDITQDTVVNGVYYYQALNINTDNATQNENRNRGSSVDVVQTTDNMTNPTTSITEPIVPEPEITGNRADNIPFLVNRNTVNRLPSDASDEEMYEDIMPDTKEPEDNYLYDRSGKNIDRAKKQNTVSSGNVNTKNQESGSSWILNVFSNIDRWIDNIASFIVKNSFALSLFIILCAVPAFSFLMLRGRKEREVKTPDGLIGYCYYSNSITGKSKVRLNINNKTIKRTYTTSTLAFVKKEA